MLRLRLLALAVIGLFATVCLAEDYVGVDGTSTQFPTTVDSKIGNRPVKLVLTGTALRTKFLFHVYALGSYVQQGTAVHNADELAAVDAPKQLHLVMERELDGKTMASAFRDAVRLNYPAPMFDQELNTLAAYLETTTVKKGDHVWLTHVPGVGFQGYIAGQKGLLIPNPRFSRAIWDIYLGKNNLGDPIKQGLTSRL